MTLDEAVRFLYEKAGQNLRLATPLGLGKPNRLLNALYERAKSDPSVTLTLFTALSLDPASAKEGLAGRFLAPFAKRQWGDEYPRLQYSVDARRGRLPPNVRVHEFYFLAGSALGSSDLQQDYQSINYTHVAARLADERLGAIVQLVAKRGNRYSLSCNPDLTLDVKDRIPGVKIIAVVHPELPFLKGECEVGPEFFDAILDEEASHRLFAIPRGPVDETDHAIGFYASQMVVDDGTLQVGIGSLSDALVAALICRQDKPDVYRRLKAASWQGREPSGSLGLSDAPFEKGLYGLSEMVMDGFMHLRRHGILKRTVKDDVTGVDTFLHGAFFLGSRPMYEWLRGLQGAEHEGVRMGRISKVNQLYADVNGTLRAQRKNARFFNTCMQVTLLGGAASETLEDGLVVSGVGGQYNFVAMAFELPAARSVLMLRSTRVRDGKRRSNLVWGHPQLTIPRHLRDVVVTEYGVAHLRGRTDQETIEALLAITDSEFQDELVDEAKRNGKLDRDYVIPESARGNTPERVRRLIREGRADGLFVTYPWGSDFTPEEEALACALEALKCDKAVLRRLWRSFSVPAAKYDPELRRMGLERPGGWKDRLARRLLLDALHERSLRA